MWFFSSMYKAKKQLFIQKKILESNIIDNLYESNELINWMFTYTSHIYSKHECI